MSRSPLITKASGRWERCLAASAAGPPHHPDTQRNREFLGSLQRIFFKEQGNSHSWCLTARLEVRASKKIIGVDVKTSGSFVTPGEPRWMRFELRLIRPEPSPRLAGTGSTG